LIRWEDFVLNVLEEFVLNVLEEFVLNVLEDFVLNVLDNRESSDRTDVPDEPITWRLRAAMATSMVVRTSVWCASVFWTEEAQGIHPTVSPV
jgi:hypothetical protein